MRGGEPHHRTGDDRPQALPSCCLGIREHLVGHPMRADHLGLMRNAEVLERLDCFRHRRPVARGPHHDTDQRLLTLRIRHAARLGQAGAKVCPAGRAAAGSASEFRRIRARQARQTSPALQWHHPGHRRPSSGLYRSRRSQQARAMNTVPAISHSITGEMRLPRSRPVLCVVGRPLGAVYPFFPLACQLGIPDLLQSSP